MDNNKVKWTMPLSLPERIIFLKIPVHRRFTIQLIDFDFFFLSWKNICCLSFRLKNILHFSIVKNEWNTADYAMRNSFERNYLKIIFSVVWEHTLLQTVRYSPKKRSQTKIISIRVAYKYRRGLVCIRNSLNL